MTASPPALWSRLRQSLMPDYHRRAVVYWWTVVPLGVVAVGWALWTVGQLPLPTVVQVAAGVLMAAAAGSFPVVVPRTKISFTLGETFTFLLLFLHGPAPAVLAAAAEAGLGSARTSKRWTSRIGGPATAAVSMLCAGSMLAGLLSLIERLYGLSLALQLTAALWFAIFHFVLNTAMFSALPRLKRGEWPRWSDISGNFGFTLVVSVASAAAAAWLSRTFRENTFIVLVTVTPALALVVAVLRGYLAQQEAARALSEAETQSARREADITARHLEEMHQIAFHDALTGLPNRRMLLEELCRAVERFQQDQRRGYALLFLDFDRFKLINDTLGHAAGDAFLTQVSQRLQSQVREEDMVARLGGDEFAVLLRRCITLEAVHELANRIQATVCEPYVVAGTVVTSSASIGITHSDRGYLVPDDVLRDADIAMYRAKATGKARHVVFDAAMHAELARRLRLEGDLRRVLAEGSLELAYQPVVDLATNQWLGLEALARWTHPELGEIEPEEFVPIAEESGLALSLTDFVLERSCLRLRQWQTQWPGCEALHIHVNLSDKDVAQRNLPERVRQVLLRTGVQPRHLVLELTEGTIMRRIATERPTLEAVRKLGAQIVIDDFGRGYSSLGQLSSLPIDALKIDRTFIADIGRHEDACTIARTILQLGQSLGKTVVAEGVENPDQVDWLRGAGCEAAQGRALAAPMAAQAVDAWLERLHGRSTADLHAGGSPAVPALH
jgi:diguanylate cyclase (GGDEF)-like protein